jgi:hypothetical protein
MPGVKTASLALAIFLMSAGLGSFALQAETDDFISIRNEILAAYQASIDALNRGDAEAALKIDTDDWISVVPGQPTRTKQEMAVYVRRDIASMKSPPEWKVVWLPDYEHNGTISGVQLYDLKVDGKAATVLYLIGDTREEAAHRVWTGSHIRDSWTQTAAGWKRRKHEKLTINERMVDGKPSNQNGRP